MNAIPIRPSGRPDRLVHGPAHGSGVSDARSLGRLGAVSANRLDLNGCRAASAASGVPAAPHGFAAARPRWHESESGLDDTRDDARLALRRERLVLARADEDWQGATLPAFSETGDLRVVLVPREEIERLANVARGARGTIDGDARDKGIAGRAATRGDACVLAGDSEEGARREDAFLAETAFGVPSFGDELPQMIVSEPETAATRPDLRTDPWRHADAPAPRRRS